MAIDDKAGVGVRLDISVCDISVTDKKQDRLNLAGREAGSRGADLKVGPSMSIRAMEPPTFRSAEQPISR
jgi:hypothetical protein